MQRRTVGFGALAGFTALAVGAFTAPPVDVHAEYVKYLSGNDTITAYLAYPERPEPAPAVIVIHEIFGLSDFIRETTEQLAEDGFVAIAPDLLSRRGGTPAAGDSARRLISSLPADSVTADLDATRTYLRTLGAVRGDAIGTIGFCWGGGQSFRYATNTPALRAFVVCYGPSPAAADLARIQAQGLGVYAENDARINAGLPVAAAALRQAGKDYRYTVYRDVGHGFLRSRDNPAVADSAWAAIVHFFRAELGGEGGGGEGD
ncbi:MAG: dienelactone hydrolase family protein [Gemmatimonadales bacterium]